MTTYPPRPRSEEKRCECGHRLTDHLFRTDFRDLWHCRVCMCPDFKEAPLTPEPEETTA